MIATSAGSGIWGAIMRKKPDITLLADSMYWPCVTSTARSPPGELSMRSG